MEMLKIRMKLNKSEDFRKFAESYQSRLFSCDDRLSSITGYLELIDVKDELQILEQLLDQRKKVIKNLEQAYPLISEYKRSRALQQEGRQLTKHPFIQSAQEENKEIRW